MELERRNQIVEYVANQLGLRTYQKECVEGLVTCFLEGYSREYLISACCRYGKTKTSLGAVLILKAVLDVEDMAITVITGLPGSVKSSWKKDANDFGLNLTEINEVDFTKTEGTDITFISTQKLGDNTNSDGDVVSHRFVEEYKEYFNNHKGVKILIVDEAHNSTRSERYLNALVDLSCDYKIELTATPYTYELIERYKLDTVNADKRSYVFSQIDMLKLYEDAKEIILPNGEIAKEGFVTPDGHPWNPVKPVIIVEDLYNKLLQEGWDFVSELEDKQTAFVTAYFQTIFSNTRKYASYCNEFIETYLIEASEKQGKNFLGFVTTNELAAKIMAYVNSHYGDRITALSLADENEDDIYETQSSVEKANALFLKDDNKIHFVLTCRKCGTGSTLPSLGTTIFMKGVGSLIEFDQFGARSFNPYTGKEYGYVVMFNSTQALRLIADAARSQEHKTPSDDPKDPSNVKPIQNYLDYIQVYADGEQLTDATELINTLDTVYNPNQSVLFPGLNLELDELFVELSEAVLKEARTSERKPTSLPNDEEDAPEDSNEDETAEDQDSEKTNSPKDRKPSNASGNHYTKESLQKAFQLAFVGLIIDYVREEYSEEDIKAIGDVINRDSKLVNRCLCSLTLWNRIRTEYFERVLHKVYLYAKREVMLSE